MTEDRIAAPETIDPAQTIASSAEAFSTNLAPGLLDMLGEDGPLGVVEVEDRLDGDQVQVRLVVRRQGPHVAPVVAVLRRRSWDVVALEVVDAGFALPTSIGMMSPPMSCRDSGFSASALERVDESVRGEDVVAHRRERLVRAVDEAGWVGGLLEELLDQDAVAHRS